MIIKELEIKGVYEIQLESVVDKRGNFTRTFDNRIFTEHGLSMNWVQENYSLSTKKNTIRGLHFQFPPFLETKLIRVVKGEIYDVFVDLREDSFTFGKWSSIILSENNNKMVLISKGFAHGFCTLTDDCRVLYKVDNYYNPLKEGGIIWNDSFLNIKFPTCEPIISDKDLRLNSFKEFVNSHKALRVK